MQSETADFAFSEATLRTRRNIRVGYDSGPCESMTSYTNQKYINVLHCRHRRTEPGAQVTHTENFLKYGHMVFEICERTDR